MLFSISVKNSTERAGKDTGEGPSGLSVKSKEPLGCCCFCQLLFSPGKSSV